MSGQKAMAEELIRRADDAAVAAWTNALWGPGGPWSRPMMTDLKHPPLPKASRVPARMPSKRECDALVDRDGYRCRFCGIPLMRKEIRDMMRGVYTEALRWRDRNVKQHAAFQAMSLRYDHIVPHARGGTNTIGNMVVTCAPCNYGRWNLTLPEVGLDDQFRRDPVCTAWDGLERFRP